MRDRWKQLQRRFDLRRQHRHGLAHALSTRKRFEAAVKTVRKRSRTIEQVYDYMRQNSPDIAQLVVELTFSRGTMTFVCENDADRYFVDRWLRSERTMIQGVCSQPPNKMRAMCHYPPSE